MIFLNNKPSHKNGVLKYLISELWLFTVVAQHLNSTEVKPAGIEFKYE